MGETTAVGVRCPRCAAAVRPGAPWCTQCYAPAGAPAEDAPEAAAPPAARAPEAAAAHAAGPASTATWPCTACDQPNDLALSACAGCGTPFLAAAREPRPTLVLPVVGDLLALTPVRRVGVAAALVVACTLVLGLLALLLV